MNKVVKGRVGLKRAHWRAQNEHEICCMGASTCGFCEYLSVTTHESRVSSVLIIDVDIVIVTLGYVLAGSYAWSHPHYSRTACTGSLCP